MGASLLVLFAVAALAPLLCRLGRGVPWLLALAPLGVCVHLVGLTPADAAELHPWLPQLGVDLAFRLDGLARFFALLVTGVGALVVVYAGGYLSHHPNRPKFFGILFAFMAAMLGVVLADDVLTLFVCWELTSLTSYLLIGFEHGEANNRASARQALVITGVGGLALLGGLILVGESAGTYRISELLAMGPRALPETTGLRNLAFTLLLLGAFTKSAQFPFHFWLPAAMAGPTPVSAYLHSATMVKAGVFLLARLSPILSSEPAWGPTLVSVGGLTMLASAWVGLRFRDLKQVLAYTTTMALGLFVLLLGLGGEGAIIGMLAYLLVHALYKGALFMLAGNIDHETGTRDLTRLSGLRGPMPVSAGATLLACASMAGLPPFLGFVAKEAIYETALHGDGWATVAFALCFGANVALFGLGAILFVVPFLGGRMEADKTPHEAPPSMLLGPVVLATSGLVLGLAPGLVDARLLAPAISAVLGAPVELHLSLWHGLTPALGASAVTVALGVAVFLGHRALRDGGFVAGIHRTFARAPAQVFERILVGLARTAASLTGFAHPGRLRYYLIIILTVFASAIWLLVIRHDAPTWPSGYDAPTIYEIGVLCLMVLGSAVAVISVRPMPAVIALGIGGFGIAVLYLMFGAPDLAMTQFAVESLTVILLVLTLIHLPAKQTDVKRPRSVVRDIVLSTAVGGAATAVTFWVLSRPLNMRLSDYFVKHSLETAHGHNIVNVILVDFRGFDTWGEITVLTVAGLGVYALLSRRPDEPEGDAP